MSIGSFYNKSARFYTFSEGAAPVYKKTWTLSETLDCALHQLSGDEQVVDYGKTKLATHRLFTDSTSAVVGERVKIDDEMYEIVFIDDPMFRAHHIELLIKLQTEEKASDYPDV